MNFVKVSKPMKIEESALRVKVFREKEMDLDVPEGSLVTDLIRELKLTAPHQSVAVEVNGRLCDPDHPLSNGDQVRIYDFQDPKGSEVFWHTSAHVLAQAVLRLWPDAKPTIGPPIENGFYYDFANLKISDADFSKIEKECQAIIKSNFQSKREVFSGKEEALKRFGENPYKCELIRDIPDGEGLSGYQQGEFFDLCRGPHLLNLGKIKAFKILKTSGAYWRGDSQNEMLTRIYGISFPDRKLLKDYLKFLEEAKKRDHKVIGPKLGLFGLKEAAPGMPFFYPAGLFVWDQLLSFLRELQGEAGYEEIKTPVMMTRDLWETSGHWQNYRENMYTTSIEKRDYAIKPMNCPGCMLYYASDVHSYRELPMRVAEIGLVHRYEASGALSGLFRVRCFHQDDAHIFMRPGDIQDEIIGALKLAQTIYKTFGLQYHMELSTRPDKDTIGTDEDWETATEGLRGALEALGCDYQLNEGDGAFYGPKIDLHIKDALGRTWQCGTIQLDMSLPERFDLEYVDQDGERKRPVMIHRALFGSIERFMGVLIEHFAGRFPLWISPRMVRMIPVADRHAPFANEVKAKIEAAGFKCDCDVSHESVGKKVRNAQMQQVNYMLTVGDQEVESGMVSVRTRNNVLLGQLTVEDFLQSITKERDERALESGFPTESK